MRIAFFVGAPMVSRIAAAMRVSGIKVTCEGEERIYVDEPGETILAARESVIKKMRLKIGKTFGLELPYNIG